MGRKLRTPEEIANEVSGDKKTYSVYLTVDNIEYLKGVAVKLKIPYSRLVDEAIAVYIAQIKNEEF